MRLITALLSAGLLLVACKPADPVAAGAPANPSKQGLTAAQLALEAPANPPVDPFDGTPYAGQVREAPAAPPPIAAAQARAVRLSMLSETGYLNEKKEYVIDLLERDMAYLTVKIETPDGRPVSGARPEFSVRGSSRFSAVSATQTSDDSGTVDFGLIGGKMGLDRLTIRALDGTTDVLVNVISLKAAGYPALAEIEGALRWDELMKARLRFNDDAVEADFPAHVAAQNNRTVKLTGFMLPLDPEQKQKHFLLTSNPPSCFFHVPGGPAGAVEVFADKGIEASWDPIILEGRFETAKRSEMGVIYRLHQARVVSR